MKKALLIGINYVGTEHELRGCINDINNFYTMLTTYFNYDKNNIVCLTENLNSANHPNKQTIMDAINWLTLNQQDGDTLTLYYSGHGSNSPDTSGDEKDGKDEVIVPLDFNQNGVITDDWLNDNLVDKIRPGVKFYSFFDSCNSGTVLDLKCNVECDTRPFLSFRDLKRLNGRYIPWFWSNNYKVSYDADTNTSRHRYCFSACLNTELANEVNINSMQQGLFSYFFQDIVRKNLTENNMQRCTLKHKDIIKAINANLTMNNFDHQNCMLSVCNIGDIDEFLSL